MSDLSAEDIRAETLRSVATMFAELGAQLQERQGERRFDAITRVALARVAGAQTASITVLRKGRFRTVSATDGRARQADELQYELGSGPCVDAIIDRTDYRPMDLSRDERWPEFGRRVTTELGMTSMLSFRLGGDYLSGDVIAGLNIYSGAPDAFPPEAVETGLLLATHSAAAVGAEYERERVRHLEQALDSSREIGIAMGVLMARNRLTRDQAFDLLRICSQRINRKLRDIAVEVADTGELPG